MTANCIPLLIQQNVNGSDFFNRSWAEFKVGFNDSRGNYWLGNDLLSQLTLSHSYKLRFDLQERGNHIWHYAEYSEFRVSGESNNYQLHVSGFSGNVLTAFSLYHNGMMFTTYDRDNDLHRNDNCAERFGGGFWYNGCGGCFVNTARGGVWGFTWYHSGKNPTGHTYLDSSRMWLMC